MAKKTRNKTTKKSFKKKFKFNYRAGDKEERERRASRTGGTFDRYVLDKYKTFRPKDGENRIRILPAPDTWDGAVHYAMTAYVHHDVGPHKSSYLCLKQMKGKKCPVCEEVRRAERKGEDEVAKELSAKEKAVMWMIDRKNEEDGPMIWAMGWTSDRDILLAARDDDDNEALEIDNPEEGYDIIFTKSGTAPRVDYSWRVARKATPLSEDEDEAVGWLKYITDHPIPETLQYYDYDHLSEVFGGEYPEDEEDESSDDEEDEDKPEEDEDEEEEDDEEEDDEPKDETEEDEEEDEEDEDDEEDDEEDEEEDEDEEGDEKPKKKLKKKSGKANLKSKLNKLKKKRRD